MDPECIFSGDCLWLFIVKALVGSGGSANRENDSIAPPALFASTIPSVQETSSGAKLGKPSRYELDDFSDIGPRYISSLPGSTIQVDSSGLK